MSNTITAVFDPALTFGRTQVTLPTEPLLSKSVRKASYAQSQRDVRLSRKGVTEKASVVR